MKLLIAVVLAWACIASAQTPSPAPDVAWPREVKSIDGNVITVYQPQVESWADNNLAARAAVSVGKPGEKEPQFGVVELSARTAVDKSADLVTLSSVRITKGSFPGASPENAEKYLATLRAALPKEGWPVSAQALQASLAVTQARSKQKALPLKNEPPRILFRTEATLLVMVDGEPALRAAKGAASLSRVINTAPLLLQDASTKTWYLWATSRWRESKALESGWQVSAAPPAAAEQARAALDKQFDPLEGKDAEGKSVFEPGVVPQIVLSTKPAELLQSKGEPKFSPIPGTQLLFMSNSSNDIFMELGTQTYYVLISGRWFSAKALTGPWAFVAGKSLPADFAKVPAEHQMADVLASVPNTPQAREAAIANQIPQTATVQRDVQPTPVVYDGEPQWKPIDGTPLTYAYNTGVPVIRIDPKTYYMAQNGVWFSGTGPLGPWAVAATVPSVIYTIPPTSPLHYVTYVRVYSSTPTTVFVGYTPGYYGTVLTSDGVVVYGTGYYYPPYIGAVYYPPPYYTYGYGAGFTVGFFFGFAMAGGWHGPCCYGGGGGVYISHHNNININNSYNRWGGKSTSITGSGGRNLQATQVGNTTLAKGSGSNNVYAGRDGNVYKRDESGNWQQHQKGSGWSDVPKAEQRPSAGQQPAGDRPSTRDQASTRDQISTRDQASSRESVQSLDRQAQSRDVGAQRAQQYRQPGGASGFQGGGGARAGGGGRGGGGRR